MNNENDDGDEDAEDGGKPGPIGSTTGDTGAVEFRIRPPSSVSEAPEAPESPSSLTNESSISEQPTNKPSIDKPHTDETRFTEATSKDGCFSLVQGLLYFSDPKEGNLRLCIPSNLTQEVLDLVHATAGHFGIRKTYLSTSKHYYMPKMSRVIRKYVNNCPHCQASKPTNERQAGLMHPVTTPEPLHTLSLDYVTGLPLSNGFDALLTVTDKFSKAIRLIPCKKETTAAETANLYFHYCYPIFGLPTKLISDRDPRFTSHFWSSLMKKLRVKLGLTAA